MKSIITKQEEKRYYTRTYLLLPIYIGLLFSIIVFILYNLILLLFFKTGFIFKWSFVYIPFGLGFLYGLSTIYFTFRVNRKKNIYYTNYNKKSRKDLYIPVTLRKGLLDSSKGVLIIAKDKIEYRIYQLLKKETLFFVPSKDATITITREENDMIEKILTLTTHTNILTLTVDEKKYEFIVPCLENITHRVDTHHI